MIERYAIHGYKKDSLKIIDLLDVDMVLWNAMITGYS